MGGYGALLCGYGVVLLWCGLQKLCYVRVVWLMKVLCGDVEGYGGVTCDMPTLCNLLM